ncbi:immunity 49 family protein [Pedobacter montanisoli]|uniref:Immunity 49 family protein n=1 Tax=Pedobacter montanisoli TaxID=2923277 RepID=A0ABS9ZYE9_9SPHI|nr:immunity 49 family protein [Pedobacter montanisoli]MCJ0743322.1 immunity 49 family protein [Pedobacter montanisoli]
MLSLKELYVEMLKNEHEALTRIYLPETDGIQSESDKRMLWYYNEIFALHSLFVENNIEKCKQYFYICGRLDEYLITNYNSRILDYGVNHFSYALLCDENSLIKSYAKLTHPWYAHTIKSGSLVHAMQCFINEDWQALEKDIATYERITSAQKGKINIPDLMYFKGMLQKDKLMIEEALLLLLKDHKKRNKHAGIAQTYISIPALGYAKLAWLKGIEVQVDHPLIPKELLPYRPLEKYEDKYDFLK